MEIPDRITFNEGLYFTDGGSIVLIGEGADRTRHQITLGQHRFLEMFDPKLLPGRLYFDHLLVPVRSEMEGQVIALLETGEIAADAPEAAEEPEFREAGPVVIVGDDLKEYYARVKEGKAATIRYLIDQVIKFVGSRNYTRIAKKIEKKISDS